MQTAFVLDYETDVLCTHDLHLEAFYFCYPAHVACFYHSSLPVASILTAFSTSSLITNITNIVQNKGG